MVPVADLDQAFEGLAEPDDLSHPFDRLIGELLSHVPEPVVMAYAITLLDGDDPSRYPTALRHMGGGHADILLDNGDFTLWSAVWGGRATQYVWTPHQGADALVPLTRHRLPRVRMQAVRALGRVGESEHLEAIHEALADEDKGVRRAAVKAMELRASQLDLDLDDLMEGRFSH